MLPQRGLGAAGGAIVALVLVARDAEELSREALAVSHSGRRIFIDGADGPVAVPLLKALSGSFSARPLNRLAAGLFELVPIEKAPFGDAR